MTYDYDKIFRFDRDLRNNIPTYQHLINFYHTLNVVSHKHILLDFSEVRFISANLLAVLGCCTDNIIRNKKNTITICNLHPEIKKVMQKNGFNKYFSWGSLDDTYKSTISYAVLNATTENLVDFERYLQLNIFNSVNLSNVSFTNKYIIIDNLLEMFNNVIDHANSPYVYVCGQYFPKSPKLSFTIVDMGDTIHQNVTNYLTASNIVYTDNTLKWAITRGNSTKAIEAPGSLGFSTLLELLKNNEGSFILISDKECYTMYPSKERFLTLNLPFPGTIVTISISLRDGNLHVCNTDDNIIF